MRVFTPEISWHERDPIYTCAFNPVQTKKFATAGVTGVIRVKKRPTILCSSFKLQTFDALFCLFVIVSKLWEVTNKESTCADDKSTQSTTASTCKSSTSFEVKFIANLKRHTKSVNCLRWNSDGMILASAGDEAVIFLWNENDIKNQKTLDNDTDENLENWYQFKIFRLTF